MLKTMIEKEIRDILGSSKFVYTFLVCAVLIILSFYSGAMNYKMNLSHWEAAKVENLRSFEGLTEWFRVQKNNIFLPPQPLTSLVSGVSNDIGRTAEISPAGEISPDDSRYNEEPVYAYFRFMDLEFIFQIVLALFAILLGYDAVSGEKERGTLKLCLSNAIPRVKFLIGKFIGAFSILSVSLLLAIGLGCLLLPVLGVHLQGTEWFRLGLIIITGLLYFGVFLAVSIFVSASTQRSSSSFLILLLVWIGATLIIPRVAVLAAGRAIDVPTVDEIGYQKTTYATGLWKDYLDAMNSFTPVQTEDIDIMMSGFNKFLDSLSQSRTDKMDAYSNRLNEERHNRAQVRSEIAFGLARISPSTSLVLATTALAGTSPELKERFYAQSKNYQTSFHEFLKEKTGMNMGAGMIIMESDTDDGDPVPIDPQEIPTFEFQPDSFSNSLASAVPDMAILFLFNCIFIVGAFITFNRYDAR